MSIWLKRLWLCYEARRAAPESIIHEWAEFNLPTRDNLEALFRAEEDANAGRMRASGSARTIQT
jgi:hypothetical protein